MADLTTQQRSVAPRALQAPASQQAEEARTAPAPSLTGRNAKIDISPPSRFARLELAYSSFKALVHKVFFGAHYTRVSAARRRYDKYNDYFNQNKFRLLDDAKALKYQQVGRSPLSANLSRVGVILWKYAPSKDPEKIHEKPPTKFSPEDQRKLKEEFEHLQNRVKQCKKFLKEEKKTLKPF